MSSLLNAIRSKTGIEFEGGENSSERVAISLGPAPEGEVLAAIFSGSGLDYVVLDRPDSPGTVQRVILTPKSKGGPVVAGNPGQPRPQQQAQPEADEETAPDEAANPPEQEPQDTAVQPPPVNQPPVTENQPQTGGPKTPEQLLQELKQMQQQQQQQQGQQPPMNQAPRKMPPQ